MNDVARIRNGLYIRRLKKTSNALQDKRFKLCLSWFDIGAYNRLQYSMRGRGPAEGGGARVKAFRP